MASDLDFIVVTGTRRRSRVALKAVERLYKELGGAEWRGLVIHGGADGVDQYASSKFGFTWTIKIPSAVWSRIGRLAGPARNAGIAAIVKTLVDDGKLGRGYAFPDSQSRGTWDCKRKLEAVGLKVEVINV